MSFVPPRADAGANSRRRTLLLAGAWLVCAAAIYGVLVAANYQLRDPDSALYEAIAHSLAARPLPQWIAPSWPAHRSESGLFLEHLAVFFWPAAALERLGASRGALLANLIYFLISLRLLFALAESVSGPEAAWLAVAAYAVSPLGIQYLIRANHENAWGLAFLGAFWSIAEGRRRAAAGVALIFFLALAFAVKGVLGLMIFPVMLAWWWAASGRRQQLFHFAAGLLLIALMSFAYEHAFHAATGRPFFSAYLANQFGQVLDAERAGILHKLYNPIYYLWNLLYFALPASLVLALALARGWLKPVTDGERLVASAGGTCLALASLMTRRAVRYVFPVYAICHVAGAELLLRRWPRLREWVLRRRALLPYFLMAWLLALVLVRVWFDRTQYRFINPL